MAIGWIYLRFLEAAGMFRDGNVKILDVGYQNLFDLPEEEGYALVAKYNPGRGAAKAKDIVRDLAVRSPWPHGPPGTQGVYFSELAAVCGFDYTAYDIFAGEQVRIVDLNTEPAPREHRGVFDCVFNFGTTEHVFNQYNAFKLIHDVTKTGGSVFHQVPTVGYINHGYWIYSPRVLLELAAANGYRVEAFWVTGPQGLASLDAEARAPELVWNSAWPENFPAEWQKAPVPNGLINALLRKLDDRPF